mmetsp:Transcript_6450/g.11534  ORF Transcript_6450/g.11534 Transcript_6450/m.11534 type:complete len:235 (+) Transcript_6450:1528-2232(+)
MGRSSAIAQSLSKLTMAVWPALETQRPPEAAFSLIARSTASGRIGLNGQLAAHPVALVSRPVIASSELSHNLGAKAALAMLPRPSPAVTCPCALPTASGTTGMSGWAAQQLAALGYPNVHASERSMKRMAGTFAGVLRTTNRPALLTLAQSTASLETGHSGEPALPPVETTEPIFVIAEFEPSRRTMERSATWIATPRSLATLDPALWTACGVSGISGADAARAATVAPQPANG